MVQVARNRSRVRCVPLGTPHEGPAAGWRTVEVRIEESSAEPGWDHLLADSTGRTVEAIVSPEAFAALDGARRWEVTAELVGPRTIRVRQGRPGDEDGARDGA